MRVDSNINPSWPLDPDKDPKKWDENKTFIDLPKKSGIENKTDKALFKPENLKIIQELANKLGLDPSRMVNMHIHWLLHSETTSRQASELVRALFKLM